LPLEPLSNIKEALNIAVANQACNLSEYRAMDSLFGSTDTYLNGEKGLFAHFSLRNAEKNFRPL